MADCSFHVLQAMRVHSLIFPAIGSDECSGKGQVTVQVRIDPVSTTGNSSNSVSHFASTVMQNSSHGNILNLLTHSIVQSEGPRRQAPSLASATRMEAWWKFRSVFAREMPVPATSRKSLILVMVILPSRASLTNQTNQVLQSDFPPMLVPENNGKISARS